MKNITSLIGLFIICCNLSFGQDIDDKVNKKFTQSEWNNIVDYVNGETTSLYINEYPEKKENEKASAKLLTSILSNNSPSNPIKSDTILSIINNAWEKTVNNIFKPIDSLKTDFPKSLDSLFIEVSDILLRRKSKVQLNTEYTLLKNKIINDYGVSEEKLVLSNENIKSSEVVIPVPVKQTINYYKYLSIPAILFLLLSIFLFLKNRKLSKKINQRKNSLEKSLNNNYSEKEKLINDLEEKLSKSNIEKNNLRSENNKLNSQLLSSQNLNIDSGTESKSPEVNFEISNIPLQAKIVYAGKPTTDNKFSNISSQPIENQTIFKLAINSDGEQANFEVILVSNFMTRSITNSPDDYLFRVCNQENSNKDFSREIVTTKQGVALLLDGEWFVKEENKATIKFQ